MSKELQVSLALERHFQLAGPGGRPDRRLLLTGLNVLLYWQITVVT